MTSIKNDPMISTDDNAEVLVEFQKYRMGHSPA